MISGIADTATSCLLNRTGSIPKSMTAGTRQTDRICVAIRARKTEKLFWSRRKIRDVRSSFGQSDVTANRNADKRTRCKISTLLAGRPTDIAKIFQAAGGRSFVQYRGLQI
jgi:hypothetical protein